MALFKIATRGAQYVMCSEAGTFNFNDTIVDINGVTKDLGSATIASAPVADIINLPVSTEVVGGHVAILIAGVGPTAYTIDLGVAGATTAYVAAASLLGAAATKVALTFANPRASSTGLNVRMTMVDSVALATAGAWRIVILWKSDGKMDNATPS